MSAAKDGGSAFPAHGPYGPTNGMTLRDWFAGQALAGSGWRHGTAEDCARDLYEVADAMIAERSK